jgi:hypothetical protein
MSGEFNRQSNDGPQEANWEGWTPPWMSDEGHGPRGWQGPRGPFGFGHGWGHRGWQGPRGFFGFGPGRFWGVPDELLALRSEAAEVARLFMIASRGAFENKERLSQLRAFLDRSRKELSDMIYGSAQSQATSESKSADSPTDIGQA